MLLLEIAARACREVDSAIWLLEQVNRASHVVQLNHHRQHLQAQHTPQSLKTGECRIHNYSIIIIHEVSMFMQMVKVIDEACSVRRRGKAD